MQTKAVLDICSGGRDEKGGPLVRATDVIRRSSLSFSIIVIGNFLSSALFFFWVFFSGSLALSAPISFLLYFFGILLLGTVLRRASHPLWLGHQKVGVLAVTRWRRSAD